MNLKKRSQSSTEFMVFIGIAIIIMGAYLAVAHNYLNLTYKQRDIISGQDLAKQIKNEINIASRVEDGYTRTLTLPSQIGNKQYTLSTSGREVIVKLEGVDYVELLTININENIDEDSFEQGEIIKITKDSEREQVVIIELDD
tara:strand:- start:694 stop:1122 length:429 start_codon:yes stop_codon:yes gene_type:complete